MDSDGEDETPPLLAAAYEGDAHALRRAIEDGADLHVEDEENYTALHWLVNNTPQGDDELRIACISALLDAGADVNRLGGLHDFDPYFTTDPSMFVVVAGLAQRNCQKLKTSCGLWCCGS